MTEFSINTKVCKNRQEEAVVSLKWFRGVEKVDGLDSPKLIFDEMKSIVVTSSESASDATTLKRVVESIFSTKKNRTNLLLGGALVVFLAFSGGSVFTFSANIIFNRFEGFLFFPPLPISPSA